MHAARSVRLLAVLALLAIASCGAPRRDYRGQRGPYDELGAATLASLEHARELRLGNQPQRAHEILEPLARVQAEKLAIGVELQEVELTLLESGAVLPGVGDPEDARPPAERLRAHYLSRAEAAPSAAALVLAARLERDAPAALRLLDAALALDGDCVWAHYGKAHVLLRSEDYAAAGEALKRALDLDPGHLPTRRLEVRWIAEGGNAGLAAAALRQWIAEAQGSPLVSSMELRHARVDLAILYAIRGDPDDAQDLLDEILAEARANGDELDTRALAARAAALFSRGRFADALRDVQEARTIDRDDVLAASQRALLIEATGDRPEAAAAWSDVLATLDRTVGEEGAELGMLVTRIQALARLQRLERELAREERTRQRAANAPEGPP